MARTIRTKIYKFNELSETAKQTAIEGNYDINVSEEWWEGVYMDAENIGLKLTEFDIERGSYCKGDFLLSVAEVAQNIFNEHGEDTETYKTAKAFMDEWQPVFNDYLDETSEHYESSESENKLTGMEDEFLKSLLEDYRVSLSQEYDYQTSKKAIIDSIVINNFEFTKDGNNFIF